MLTREGFIEYSVELFMEGFMENFKLFTMDGFEELAMIMDMALTMEGSYRYYSWLRMPNQALLL